MTATNKTNDINLLNVICNIIIKKEENKKICRYLVWPVNKEDDFRTTRYMPPKTTKLPLVNLPDL